MRIYTGGGDDGTTGLRHGERVSKASAVIEANGAIDEAQAALGLARAECARGSELDEVLVSCERDLWVVMAEVASLPERRRGAEAGVTAVSTAMVRGLEAAIDTCTETLELSPHFAVPGGSRASACLDVARTVVRRAERAVVAAGLCDSLVVTYLNRLSDLCFVLARASEDEHLVNVRGSRAARGKTRVDKEEGR